MPTHALHTDRYTLVAIALHWAIALLILFNLTLGFFMEGFQQPLRQTVVQWHVSAGLTVLALTLVRIVWRLTHRPPPFPDGMKTAEVRAAHTAHAILYCMMLLMPLVGWAIVSAHPPASVKAWNVWGFITIPPLSPVVHIDATIQKQVHDNLVEVHSVGGWIMVALLLLHVAAALKHQFYDRQREFARMGLGS